MQSQIFPALALALLLMLVSVPASPAKAVACDVSWLGGNGSWNDPAKWDTNVVPGVGLNVCITAAGDYVVSAPGNTSVGNLTLGAGSGSQTLRVFGNNTVTTAYFSAPGGLTINSSGTLVLTSMQDAWQATLDTAGGGTTNAGRIQVQAGAGGVRQIFGSLVNTGEFSVFTNTSFAPGWPYSFTNAGTVHVATGVIFDLTSTNGFTQDGGILDLDGTLKLHGTASTFNSGQITGNPPYVLQSQLSYGAAPSHPATIILAGSTLASDVPANQTLLIRSDNTAGAVTVSLTDSYTNHGTIRLESADDAWGVNLHVPSGEVFTNAGTLSVDKGAGGSRVIDARLNNTGTLSINWPTDLTAIGCASHPSTNSGTIWIAAGQTLDLSFCGNADFTQTAGSIAGPGLFKQVGGNFTFNGGAITGTSPYLAAVNLTLGAATGPGNFILGSTNNTISGNVQANHTVTIQGNNLHGMAAATVNGNVTNHGKIIMTTIDDVWSSTLTVQGTLTNSGTLHVAPGAGGDRYLYGNIGNTGGLIVDRSAYVNHGIFADHWLNNLGTLVIAAGQTLDVSGQEFNQIGGELTINGMFWMDDGDFFYFGGAIKGSNGVPSLQNSDLTTTAASPAKFLLTGSDSELLGDLPAGQTITVRGNSVVGSAGLTLPNGAANFGTIILDTVDDQWGSTLLTPQGRAFTNNGAVHIHVGAGGPRTIMGRFVNNGALNIAQSTVYSPGQPATFTNNGALSIAAGAIFETAFQAFEQEGGQISGGGVLTTGFAPFKFNGGALNVKPRLVNAMLALGPTSPPAEFLIMGQTNQLRGNVRPGQTLRLQGNSTFGSAFLTSSVSFANDGAIIMETVDDAWEATIWLTSGALTNNGTLTVLPGAGGLRNIYGHLTNNGTLTVAHSLLVYTPGADPVTIRNNGTLKVDPGKELDVSGQQFIQAGGTLTIAGGFPQQGGVFRYTGGTITGTPNLRDLTLDLTSMDPINVLARGSVTLVSKIAAGQKITVQGDNGIGSSVLQSGGADLVNAGEIVMTTKDDAWNSVVQVPPGSGKSVVNTGTIRVLQGAGGGRYLWGTFVNRGMFDVQANLSLQSGAPNRNEGSGTIQVAAGRTLHSDGPISNSGTVTVASGGSLTLYGDYNQNAMTTTLRGATLTNFTGGVKVGGGTLAGSGTIGSHLLNSGGTVAPGGSPGRLTVVGDYTQTGGGSLAIEIGGTNVNSQYDQLAVQGMANLGGTLSISQTSAFIPASGDRFDVMTFVGWTGKFTMMNGLDLGGGLFYSPTFTPTALRLTAGAPWQAKLTLTDVSGTWQTGQAKNVTVTAENRGSMTWNANGSNPVRLRARFHNASDQTLGQIQVFPLPAGDVAPGGSAVFTVSVTAPPALFADHLDFTMLREGIGTFPAEAEKHVTVVSPFKAQTSGVSSNLLAVSALHGNIAYAVGVGGVILKTTDGGNTWNGQTSGTSEVLFAVDAADEKVAWAVGANSTALMTVDGGTNWTSVTTGAGGTLTGVAAVSANTVFITGEVGTIIRTDNGGANWTFQTTGTTEVIRAISAVDARIAWAVGDNSTVLRTLDGGQTWSPVTADCCVSFRSVAALSDTHAWFAGDSGTVGRSTDGATSHVIFGLGGGNMRSITSRSSAPGVAWAVDTVGRIYRTTDGGVSWWTQYSGGTPLSGISVAGSGIWAVGNGGTIVKATP